MVVNKRYLNKNNCKNVKSPMKNAQYCDKTLLWQKNE